MTEPPPKPAGDEPPPLVKNPSIDWFTADGARILAQRIREYWAKRGYLVQCQPVMVKFIPAGIKRPRHKPDPIMIGGVALPELPPERLPSSASVYGVRSDMLNGWPRARKDEEDG
jgi:hypothetical protein